jgi:hypothetical protein
MSVCEGFNDELLETLSLIRTRPFELLISARLIPTLARVVAAPSSLNAVLDMYEWELFVTLPSLGHFFDGGQMNPVWIERQQDSFKIDPQEIFRHYRPAF